MSGDDFSDIEFAIAFPPLARAENPSLGRFVRQDKGELAGLHCYQHPKTKAVMFSKAEFDKIYPVVIDEFIEVMRPFRSLPSPLPLMFRKLEKVTTGTPADTVTFPPAVQASVKAVAAAPHPAENDEADESLIEVGDIVMRGANRYEVSEIKNGKVTAYKLTTKGSRAKRKGRDIAETFSIAEVA